MSGSRAHVAVAVDLGGPAVGEEARRVAPVLGEHLAQLLLASSPRCPARTASAGSCSGRRAGRVDDRETARRYRARRCRARTRRPARCRTREGRAADDAQRRRACPSMVASTVSPTCRVDRGATSSRRARSRRVFAGRRPSLMSGATSPRSGRRRSPGIVWPAMVSWPIVSALTSSTFGKFANACSNSGGIAPKLVPDRGVPVPAVQAGCVGPALQVRAERERRGDGGDDERQARQHAAHRCRGRAPARLQREAGADDRRSNRARNGRRRPRCASMRACDRSLPTAPGSAVVLTTRRIAGSAASIVPTKIAAIAAPVSARLSEKPGCGSASPGRADRRERREQRTRRPRPAGRPTSATTASVASSIAKRCARVAPSARSCAWSSAPGRERTPERLRGQQDADEPEQDREDPQPVHQRIVGPVHLRRAAARWARWACRCSGSSAVDPRDDVAERAEVGAAVPQPDPLGEVEDRFGKAPCERRREDDARLALGLGDEELLGHLDDADDAQRGARCRDRAGGSRCLVEIVPVELAQVGDDGPTCQPVRRRRRGVIVTSSARSGSCRPPGVRRAASRSCGRSDRRTPRARTRSSSSGGCRPYRRRCGTASARRTGRARRRAASVRSRRGSSCRCRARAHLLERVAASCRR